MGGCPIDPEQHQSRLPYKLAGFWVGGLLPDVGVPVLGCRDDAIGVGSPIDRRD